MTDLYKLINRLESLDFKKEDYDNRFEYKINYKNSDYVFVFIHEKKYNVIINKFDYDNFHDDNNFTFKTTKGALEYLNKEFNTVLRKRKINSIL